MSVGAISLLSLPDELLTATANFLSKQDLFSFASASKQCYQAAFSVNVSRTEEKIGTFIALFRSFNCNVREDLSAIHRFKGMKFEEIAMDKFGNCFDTAIKEVAVNIGNLEIEKWEEFLEKTVEKQLGKGITRGVHEYILPRLLTTAVAIEFFFCEMKSPGNADRVSCYQSDIAKRIIENECVDFAVSLITAKQDDQRNLGLVVLYKSIMGSAWPDQKKVIKVCGITNKIIDALIACGVYVRLIERLASDEDINDAPEELKDHWMELYFEIARSLQLRLKNNREAVTMLMDVLYSKLLMFGDKYKERANKFLFEQFGIRKVGY